jgi:hypothetical protein
MPDEPTKRATTTDAASLTKAITAAAVCIRNGLWRELGFGHQQQLTVSTPRNGAGTVAHVASNALVSLTYALRDGQILVAVSGKRGEFDPATDDGMRGLAGAVGDALNERLGAKTS